MRICKVTFLAEVMWGIVQDAIPLAFYYYIWLNVMFFEQEKRIYPLYWDQDKIKIEK